MEPGTVTSVRYEDGGVVCNVRAVRVDTQYEGLPVVKSHPAVIEVPRQGDTVLMEEVNSQRMVVGILDKQNETPSSVAEGDFAIQLDADTAISFSKQSDGSHDVAVKASGDVQIEAAGDVNITTQGDVFINGTNFDGHTHDYGDETITDTSDGTGTSNETTKTTNPPN